MYEMVLESQGSEGYTQVNPAPGEPIYGDWLWRAVTARGLDLYMVNLFLVGIMKELQWIYSMDHI